MAKSGFSLMGLQRHYLAEAALRQVLAEGPDPELGDRVEFALEQLLSMPKYGPRPLHRSCLMDSNPACQAKSPSDP